MKKKNKNEIDSNCEKSVVWNLYWNVKDFVKGDSDKSEDYDILARTCIHNGFSSYLLNLFIEKCQCEKRESTSDNFIQNCFLKETETIDKQHVEPEKVIFYQTPTRSKVWIVILAVLWFVNIIIIAFLLLIVSDF